MVAWGEILGVQIFGIFSHDKWVIITLSLKVRAQYLEPNQADDYDIQ